MATSMEGLLTRVQDWRFTPGVTPLTAWYYPIIFTALYLLLVKTIPILMMNRKPFEFPRLIYLHNLFLSIASLLLATALTTILLSKHLFENHSFYSMICSQKMHEDGRLHFIYAVNHILKYIEFIDTFFLTLRKKSIPFLHTYHHAATLILTWSQLAEHSTVQWVPILLNLIVHVVMYYYYARASLGYKVWWKKYLTSMQIVQFVVDMGVIGYAYGSYLKNGFRGCYGTDRGAITGICVLMSYLVLFVRFYLNTYSAKAKKSKVQMKIEAIENEKKLQ